MSKIDYEKIRQANIEEYGKGTRHLSYFADIYSTRTHFIFEVLQNAEDALSRRELSDISGYVHFDLHSDKLEIRHNGKPFDERDVIGICGIGEGTKAGDYTQIGKFGIGFKSVYAYSFFPAIHSENEHFKIERFVEPHAIEAIASKDTLIVLPFDQPENRPEWAFRDNVNADIAVLEVSRAISKLNIRTLLFLQRVEKIEWIQPSGKKGILTRKNKSENKQDNWRIVEVSDHQGKIEQWQIFAKEIDVTEGDKKHPAKIEIAFLLEKGKVIKANDTELVISFPTEKKTELGFLIQAPFKATKSRDNIKSDDAVNHQIINTAAQLVADSLLVLRDSKKLNVASYNALPLNEEHFPENSFFRPIYNQVRHALKTQALLPAQNDSFIKANEAKLARVQALVNLFSPEQLGSLFDKQPLFWLDASITNDAFLELYRYLTKLVDGIQVTPENLVSKLTAYFFSKQSINWLIQFILYAEQGAKILRSLPFVRLQSGKQVALPENSSSKPTAWFVPSQSEKLDLSSFPLVHAELAANETVRELLKNKGIGEIDAVEMVVKSVLPKYQNLTLNFDELNHQADLDRIRKAYTDGNDTAKTRFNSELKNVAWLACVHASGNMPDKIVWKKPNDEKLFERNNEHETWFAGLGNIDAYFLHPIIKETLNDKFINDVIKPISELTKNLEKSDSRNMALSNSHSNHKHGLNGFNPNAEIIGLEEALAEWNWDKCLVLWEILLRAPRIISGYTQFARNRNELNAAEKKLEYTEAGQLLCNSTYKWLPNKQGNWHKPSKLLLTDLPDDFQPISISAREVAEKLGMKKPEVEQALDIIVGDDLNLKRLIESYKSGSNSDREKMLKLIPQEVPPQPAPAFKDGISGLSRRQKGSISPNEKDDENYPIQNTQRYQNKLNQSVEEDVKEHLTTPQTTQFSLVNHTASNKSAREFLYAEYKGQCQITADTFPKASANANGEAENYFEACSLLAYGNADYLNNEGNMLCVSADTMAKLKTASFEWLDDLATIIDNFEQRATGEKDTVAVKIRLAGEECEITWSERHFARLVALWNKA